MTTRLHREGKYHIPVSFLVLALIVAGGFAIHCVLGWILAPLGLGMFLLILNFFRNPIIDVTVNPNQIIAPCDGKVVVIEDVQDDRYFKGKVTQISIFMSPLNVHVNRNPIAGTVRMAKYLPGKYLMAFNPKSSTLNEQTYMVVENEKVTVAYKQIAGFLARRICWYIKEGDKVEQSQEFGFIKFGSRIDILMPTDCKVNVQLGDITYGGRTVIAEVA